MKINKPGFIKLISVLVVITGIQFSPISVLAQEKIPVKRISSGSLKSDILKEERFFNIYLPANYGDPSVKYPVLYLLDGETHLQHASGAVDFLSVYGVVPPMIIVAINNIDRTRDFSPVKEERFPTSGGAKQFLKFLSEEMVPFIDNNYRSSGFNILMGHSFGGTFATYSLLNDPDLFDGYIAISPYLHYANSYLLDQAKSKLRRNYSGRKYFFMTVGSEPDYEVPLDRFTASVKKISSTSITFKYTRIDSENHATVPYISLFSGLKFIFSDWQLSEDIFEKGMEAIDEHYASIAEIYHLNVSAPENIINTLGYNYLGNGNIEKAIEIFTVNVERYPDSPNVYDSLGEAYESNSQLDLAEKNYSKAYELASKQNHINTAVYKQNMERLSGN